MALFPPILDSYKPAMPQATEAQRKQLNTIEFRIPDITSIDEVSGVHVKIMYQTNGANAVKSPEGYIQKDIKIDEQKKLIDPKLCSIVLTDEDIKWKNDTFYKVQMRFYKEDDETTKTLKLSEWSTIMVLKVISEPKITIENSGSTQSSQIENYMQNIAMIATETSQTPLFTGSFAFGVAEETTLTANDVEVVDKYKFILYDENKNIIEDSGWLQHNFVLKQNLQDNLGSIDTHRFRTLLEKDKLYQVVYRVQTLNLYENESKPYVFQVADLSYASKLGFNLIIDYDSLEAKENACFYVKLSIPKNYNLIGNFVLTRASEKVDRNYGVWEDLYYYNVTETKIFTDEAILDIYTDYTIESGTGYKYKLWFQNAAGLRIEYAEFNDTCRQFFEHSYIYCNGAQLKLEYNLQLSSFKHTTLANKQDTLGSKYPTILRNGQAYYGEFPLSGLISIKSDKQNEFLKYKDFDTNYDSSTKSGLYYRNELVIPKENLDIKNTFRKSYQKEMGIFYDFGNSDNMIYVERCYREKVEEFLSDGEYKLYKSPTEGNMIIALINTSLTPNATLGRMIFDFSATAYEVADCLLDNLDSTNIIDIGQAEKILDEDENSNIGKMTKVGQIQGYLFNDDKTAQNIIKLIEEQEEYQFKAGSSILSNRLISIDKIWIEPYPKVILNYKIDTLKYEQTKEEINTNRYNELMKQIQYWEKIKSELVSQERYPIITFNYTPSNGEKQIFKVNKNRTLYLEDIDISGDLQLQTPSLCIVNYICTVLHEQKEENLVTKVYAQAELWNQLDGLFVEDSEKNYDFFIQYDMNYKQKRDYQLQINDLNQSIDDLTKIPTQLYNVYKSVNLVDIIRQDAIMQVEKMLGFSKDKIFVWNEEAEAYVAEASGSATYHLNIVSINSLTIEAQTDNFITINDKDKEQKMYIGAGQVLHLKDTKDLNILHTQQPVAINLQDYTHAIVYYRVTVDLRQKGGVNQDGSSSN